jgi:hypothetical protein
MSEMFVLVHIKLDTGKNFLFLLFGSSGYVFFVHNEGNIQGGSKITEH